MRAFDIYVLINLNVQH